MRGIILWNSLAAQGGRFRVRTLILCAHPPDDVADIVAIVTHLIDTGRFGDVSLNVACPFSVPVLDIVRAFERVLGKAALYDTVMAGADYPIDTAQTQAVAAQIGLVFDGGYIQRLIGKYYG